MKKSAIRRKTPLRSKAQLRRAGRIKRVSKKTAAKQRRERPFRQEANGMNCEVCGKYGCNWHEIARGADRHKATTARCAILALCPTCHDLIHKETGTWTVARQLAVLLVARPEDFDLAAFCEIRGRAEGAVTREEVEVELRLMEGE